MKNLLTITAVLLLTICSFASAQYLIVGPPDDQTYIDTTGGLDPGTYTPLGKPLLGPRATLPVRTVNITQLDCSLFPLICSYVEALDSLGNPVAGLIADSFCVIQDGTPIPIGSYTVQQLTQDSCITSICLVVDVSGSMAGSNLTGAKDAMRRFVRNMDPYDRVAIVSFASSIVTEQTFTSDTTLLLSKINGLVASGNTACFDGVWQGVNLTIPELGSKAVIAFTDGLENRSHITALPPDGVGSPATDPYTDDSTIICNLAKGAGIPIYTFNLGPITNTYYNPEAMQAFATGTGGFWRHAPTGSQIDSIYTQIKDRLCTRYKICYTSLDTIPNGQTHVTKICHKVGGNCVDCDSVSCQESSPPVLTLTPPTEDLSDTCQSRTTPLQICVKVKDADTPPASFTVRLFYRFVGAPSYPIYTDVPMTQGGGPSDSIFCYTISSGQNCRSALEYYITVSDGQFTISSPQNNPQNSPYSIQICPTQPPVATCPGDTTIGLCSLTSICIPGFSATDPDGNLATKTVSVGTLSGNQVCFTPVIGANQIRLIATDSCGMADTCITNVTVTLNTPPDVACHADTTVRLCAPGQVCISGFTATDAQNNIVTKTVSLGTLTGNTVCFNASASGAYQIRFIATDACGKADTCTTNVTVILNSRPDVNCHADTAMFVCNLNPICLNGFTASDPNNNIQSITATGGTLSGNQVCFTPVAGLNTIRVIAIDSCGAADTCFTNVTVTLNSKPTVQCPGDTTIFVCNLNQICLNGFVASDVNNNLTSTVLTGGTLSGSQGCFTPVVGVNTLKLVATDACGAKDSCVTNVTVVLNTAPVATCPGNSAMQVCGLSQVCIPGFSATDIDGNLSGVTVNTGTFDGSQVCFTPVAGANLVRLIATDACGKKDTCETTITVTVNQPPVAVCHADTAMFLCGPAQVCLGGFSATDPDGNLNNVYAVGGTLSGNQVCFTPVAGVNTIMLIAEDDCEKADTCITQVTVTFNQAPVASCPSNSTVFACNLQPICISGFSATDPNGNLSTVTVSNGTLSGNQVCFTPVDGLNTIRLIATDACGVADTCVTEVTVDLNDAPVTICPNDTTLFVCNLSQICLPGFSATDPNNNLSSTVLRGGSLSGNQGCFTPVVGVNTLWFVATDACGAKDSCMTQVTVNLNTAPEATCPGNSQMLVCNLSPICISGFSATDPDGNLTSTTVNNGTFNGSQVCFTPVAGANVIRLIATDACGKADTCTTTITVTLNQKPVATCHGDTTMFLCAPTQVCLSGFSATDPNNNLTSLTAIGGTLSGNQICFTPVAGVNTIKLVAVDACGLADTCITNVNVTFNQAPDAVCPGNLQMFLCDIAPICVQGFSATDANGNLTSIVASPGTFSGNQVCFTPVAGLNTIRLIATDACGAADTCFANITVVINSAPAVTCAGDTTMFVCNLNQICRPLSISDIDGNIADTTVTGGTIIGNQVCFTPHAGMNTITVVATDDCGDQTQCVMNVNVILNTRPELSCPPIQTLFVCNLNQICLNGFTAVDLDNNITGYQVTGGVIQGNQLCFTPVVGSNTIRVIATDACGAADTCATTITVNLNTAPAANAGSDQVLNCRASGVPICWNASCTDVDANLQSCELVSPVGTYSGGQICFSPTTSGSYSFILKATDQCGAVDLDTAVIQVQINAAPQLTLAASDTSYICLDSPPQVICVPFTYSDTENNISGITLSGLSGGILNYAGGSGTVCYNQTSDSADFSFTLTCTDACGLNAQAFHHRVIVPIDCDTATCFTVQVEKTHNTLQGHYENVTVQLESEGAEVGGFDFLIKYDNSGLSFVDAQIGEIISTCGWEYFTYRFGAQGNCSGPCPSGLVRVVALADMNNGANHPSCYGAADNNPHSLFDLRFLVTNDRNFECQYLPIGFFWFDCGDNSISTPTGDTLYLDKRIYTFEGNIIWDELNDALYPDASRPFGVGAEDFCLIGDKYHPIRCIEFVEGGIDIVCADSIDAPGDINLNGVAFEIADAVMFTNYFLYGINALDPDPMRREAQVAASDANRDGTPLSIGDLVYMLRVIVGDALPITKLTPFANDASVIWQGGELMTSSSVNIGAVLASFKVAGDHDVTSSCDMEVLSSTSDGILTVLIYPGLSVPGRSIPAGKNDLISVTGEVELVSAEVADYEGNMLNASVAKSTLPTAFALRQNRPNPFNPTTQIEIDLPVQTDWRIDIINITGQVIKTLTGTGQGRVITSWDALDSPSGVYLYRLTAGSYSATKKMMLLK